MPIVYKGDLDGSSRRIGIVVSRFSKVQVQGKSLGEVLLLSCLERLREARVPCEAIQVVHVPGAFEIPPVARELAVKVGCEVVIALGAVIQGETPHFDYVAGETARGVALVSLETGVPVIFGVLTCATVSQAIERAGGKHGHKGLEAAEAALEIASVRQKLRESSGEELDWEASLR
jgi:6,7-dimethyl-8-ribityllumazine synthase